MKYRPEGKGEMQKRTLIHLIGIPSLILAGGIASAIYFIGVNNNLKDRARAVESKLAEAQSLITDLEQSNSQLDDNLQRSLQSVARLEDQKRNLGKAVSDLGRRVVELEDSIRNFAQGLGSLEGTSGEIGTIIQQSLTILQGISERSK